MNNINEDIERCKNLIGYVGCELREIEANLIENVLSELENYKKAYELETYERQKFIDELDTWKKIAEKLADELDKKGFCIGGMDECKNKCKKHIITWARKEVDKEWV